MKTMPVIRILSVLVMVFPVLAAATPAYAGGDTHYQYVDKQFVFDEVWNPNEGYNQCSFDMQVHIEGIWRINYWFDENGNLTRELDIWGGLKLALTANGKTVYPIVQGSVHNEFMYPSENVAVLRITHTGASGLTTIPGYGKIVFGSGQFIEVLTFNTTNPNNWILTDYSVEKEVGNQNQEDWEAFCEYMGP